jgi:hypothetical protein
LKPNINQFQVNNQNFSFDINIIVIKPFTVLYHSNKEEELKTFFVMFMATKSYQNKVMELDI